MNQNVNPYPNFEILIKIFNAAIIIIKNKYCRIFNSLYPGVARQETLLLISKY